MHPVFSHLTLDTLETGLSVSVDKEGSESQEGEGPAEAHRVEAKVKFSCMLALCGVSASLCSRDPLLLDIIFSPDVHFPSSLMLFCLEPLPKATCPLRTQISQTLVLHVSTQPVCAPQ